MKTNDKILQKLTMIFMSVIISICSMPVVASATELDIEENAVLADSLVEEAVSTDSILVDTTTDEIVASDTDDLLMSSEPSEVITNDELVTGDSVTFKFYVGKDGGLSRTPDGYWYNGLDTYTANKPTKMSAGATVKMIGMPYWTPNNKKFIGWESPDGRWRGGDVPLSQLKSAKSGEEYVFTAVYKDYQITYFLPNSDAEFVMDSGRFFIDAENPFNVWDGFDAEEKDTYSLIPGEYVIPKAGKQFTGWETGSNEKVTNVSEIDFEAGNREVMLFGMFDSVATNTLTLTNLTGIDQSSINTLKNQGFTVNGDTATLVFSKANEKFYLPTISKNGQDFYGWYETGKSPSTASLSVQFDPTIGRDISYTANFNEAISVALRNSLKLYQGQKVKLNATVGPEGTSQEVYWTSSDASVVSLTDNTVKAENVGTAYVTAISKIDSSKSATCKVTVLRSEVIETDNPGEYAINEETGEMNVWVAGLKKTGYYYTGTAIKPRIHVYDGGALLRENVDYTLSYKNNVKVSNSKAQIIIKMKGQYSGTEVVYFDILPTPVGKLVAKDDNLIASYSNKKNHLRPTLTYQGSDLKYGNNDLIMKWFETDSSGNATNVESDCVAPGLYAVKVYAGNSGNFTADEAGYQVATIRVYGNVAMTNVKVNGFKSKLPYNNGAAVEQPEVRLSYKSKTLILNEDYTVTYQDNRDLGMAKVTYEAIKDADGNYSGEFAGKVVKTYNLTGKYTNVDVTLAKDSYKFTNAAIKPRVTAKATFVDNDGDEVTRTLVQDRDYTVSYKNNKAVAVASGDKAPQVIVKGKGNYAFSIVKYFTITKTDFSSLILTISDKPYSKKAGGYKSPKIVFTDKNYRDLKLKAGKDYTIDYATSDGSETPAPGQIVYVAINAKEGSSYTGNIAGEYRITGPMYTDVSKAKVVVNPNSKGKTTACAYTGSKVEPGQTGQPGLVLTVGKKTLKAGVDYEILSYHNNIDPGKKATVVVRGLGDYRGVRAINFAISAKPVSSHWGGIFGW